MRDLSICFSCGYTVFLEYLFVLAMWVSFLALYFIPWNYRSAWLPVACWLCPVALETIDIRYSDASSEALAIKACFGLGESFVLLCEI